MALQNCDEARLVLLLDMLREMEPGSCMSKSAPNKPSRTGGTGTDISLRTPISASLAFDLFIFPVPNLRRASYPKKLPSEASNHEINDRQESEATA